MGTLLAAVALAIAMAVALIGLQLAQRQPRVPTRGGTAARPIEGGVPGQIERQSAPPVRWGLVFILILVGTVALWRGLMWYFDPMRQTERAIAAPPVAVASSPAAAEPAQPRLPDATREELALVSSRDSGNQRKGADTLLARAITPDVVAAVESALRKKPAPDVEARLVCLKSRFDEPAILEFLLARFPKDPAALAWNLKPEVTCVLDALVARSRDAPERIRDALMPAIYSGNASTREKALAAFRTMDLPLPSKLVAEAATKGTPHQREALAAALALGAVRQQPALVSGALADPPTHALVKAALQTEPHPNAARIVASVAAERSIDRQFEELARAREAQFHDVSAALLDIVLDPAEPEYKRIGAAEQLGRLVEVGPLRDLRTLAPTLGPGRLKSSVDATIRALETHQKNGWQPQMRALPKA